MGIIISTNSSLDGIVQDPDGQEGTERGGWFGRAGGADLDLFFAALLEEALAAEALLLGRRTDQWFAARWLTRTGPFADRLNGMPKYVVSSTSDEPAWSNATILGDLDQVAKLRESTGDVLVYASYQLTRALLDHGLVDEIRLAVFPIIVGAGTRLFGDTTASRPLQQVSSRTIGTGLTLLTYQVG
ncbi:MAG TPA: dihydrofolate reductase family protein [Mycobacteriales bacterium]